jgi:GNAT superfamily N-acetyltransferase
MNEVRMIERGQCVCSVEVVLFESLGYRVYEFETEDLMSGIRITKGYMPGSLGRVAELHGTYYNNHWGFGLFFEAKVATELSEFLVRYDESRDGFWTASVDDRVEGSITIDGIHAESEGAHLRWFIMSDALRGKGAGNRLIDTALAFCRSKGYKTIYLWTFEGLNPARHLYEKAGFRLAEEHRGTQWGNEVKEQRFECCFA